MDFNNIDTKIGSIVQDIPARPFYIADTTSLKEQLC